MDPTKNYFLVGLFIVATLVAAALFTVWLGAASKNNTALYRIRFAESVSGLTVGSAVKFRGVDVGTVKEILIDPDDNRLIRVDVTLNRTTPIKTDTIATMKPQGITGAVFVELSGGTPGAQDLAAATPAGQVPEIRSESSSISAIVNALPDLLAKTSRIADRIATVFSDENLTAFTHTLGNLERVSGALDEQRDAIRQLLENGNAVAADLHDITGGSKEHIHAIMQNLSDSSQQLDATMIDLRRTARDVGSLADSLKEDPSRILFSAPEKGVPAP